MTTSFSEPRSNVVVSICVFTLYGVTNTFLLSSSFFRSSKFRFSAASSFERLVARNADLIDLGLQQSHLLKQPIAAILQILCHVIDSALRVLQNGRIGGAWAAGCSARQTAPFMKAGTMTRNGTQSRIARAHCVRIFHSPCTVKVAG